MKTLKVVLFLTAIAATLVGCGSSVSSEESMAPQLENAFGKKG